MDKKKRCDITKDLLPLYADEICSQSARGFVEEHLAECEDCRQELEDYRYNTGLPEPGEEKEVFTSFSKKMKKRNLKKIVVSVVACLALILGSTYILFIPEFTVPYSDDLLTVKIPEDEGVNVWINLPNYTQVYSAAEYNGDEIDVYLTVTRNLWSMIAPDYDEMNNFWRTNGFIGVSFQASDDMPFKESDTEYFHAENEIVRIHYAEFESSHMTNRKADFQFAVHSGKAESHLIWSASEQQG